MVYKKKTKKIVQKNIKMTETFKHQKSITPDSNSVKSDNYENEEFDIDASNSSNNYNDEFATDSSDTEPANEKNYKIEINGKFKVTKSCDKRYRDLYSLLVLDFCQINIYNQSIFDKSRQYLSNYQNKKIKQMSIQTGDYTMSESCQTDKINKIDVSVQSPEKYSQNVKIEIANEIEKEKLEKDSQVLKFLQQVESPLSNYLRLIVTGQSNKSKSNLSISSVMVTILSREIKKIEKIYQQSLKPSISCFSDNNYNYLMVVYSNESMNASFLAIFHICDDKNVLFVSDKLHYKIVKASFGLATENVLICGCDDGVIVIFQKRVDGDSIQYIPVYDTSYLSSISEKCHRGAIVSIELLLENDNKFETVLKDVEHFYFYTFDNTGLVICWCIKLNEKHSIFETNLKHQYGQLNNSKVKLNIISYIHFNETNFDYTDMIVYKKIGKLFASNQQGSVSVKSCVSSNFKCYPSKLFSSEDDEIVFIDVSNFEPLLLVSYQNGNIYMYHINWIKNDPILSLLQTTQYEITGMKWSQSRPSIFYVLDKNSNLHIWNLLQSNIKPTCVEKICDSQIECMSLSCDYFSTGIGSSNFSNCYMSFCLSNGDIKIYALSKKFGTLPIDDNDKFDKYLHLIL
ncbi:hypothetical protein A3Q56_03313 [Intoshia linei]|uniref:WD repeat-containing protein 60 n=1 Tax=Intoshia linei TaxID=1819745 RepID=A0A177B5M2_9BILA|nr:hypothetical protein A3Q56_03313 [Intoshia linei]